MYGVDVLVHAMEAALLRPVKGAARTEARLTELLGIDQMLLARRHSPDACLDPRIRTRLVAIGRSRWHVGDADHSGRTRGTRNVPISARKRERSVPR